MAAVAIVLSGLWLTGLVTWGLVHADSPPVGAFAPSSAPAGTTEWADLFVGECLEVPNPLPLANARFVPRPCAGAHNGEVVSESQLDGPSYPGLDQVKTSVGDTCKAAVLSYSGTQASALHAVFHYPTAGDWSSGIKGTACIAVDRAGDVTTTLKDSGL